MNLNRLNKLIKRIEFVSDYIDKNGTDPLLLESLNEYQEVLKQEYGSFLQERLFEVYDEYFEDDEMSQLNDYIGNGVLVFGDELMDGEVYLKMKSSPLRIQVNDIEDAYCKVLWKAA